MAIGSTNIKFSTLRDTFDDSNPVLLSDYIRGGTLVPDISVNQNIPPSATNIKLSQFNGADNIVYTSITSVDASSNLNVYIEDNTGNWPQTVYSSRTCGVIPDDDGYYLYSWVRIGTVNNNGSPLGSSGTSTNKCTWSDFLDLGGNTSSNKETWRITVTDGNGGTASDTLDVQLHSQDAGS